MPGREFGPWRDPGKGQKSCGPGRALLSWAPGVWELTTSTSTSTRDVFGHKTAQSRPFPAMLGAWLWGYPECTGKSGEILLPGAPHVAACCLAHRDQSRIPCYSSARAGGKTLAVQLSPHVRGAPRPTRGAASPFSPCSVAACFALLRPSQPRLGVTLLLLLREDSALPCDQPGLQTAQASYPALV